MKQSKRLSIFTTFLLSVGLLTFIPTISPAQAAATCSGNTCSQTFAYSASAQSFTPTAAGVNLTFTINGGGGGHGGGDAGGGGGTGSGGSRVTFEYVTTSASPLYIYVGSVGGNGSGGSCSGAGSAGANPWTSYNGGRGGYPGCTGSSGAGGGGGAASLVSTGDKTGIIAIAGGGAGGGGANINSNGTNGGDDTGAQAATSTGANGQDFGGDGSGGGGGGAGLTGGTGGAAVGDGGSPAGRGGVAGKSSFPAASRGTSTSNINFGSGSITITWPNGPSASTRPSFTDTSIAKVGQVLTPADGVFVASAGTVTLGNKRWQISTDGSTWTDISPITSGNYTIASGDAGKYVRFAEDATDSNATITWGSLPSLQITGIPVFTAENPTDTSANTTVNTAYAGYTFVASGYRNLYTISAGALPAGITLNSSTGVLSGTSTATGTYKYKVKVTNEAGSDETVELTLIVGKAPVFTSDDSSLQSVNRVTNPIRVGSAITDFAFTATAYLAATFELKTDAATIPACVSYATTCASSFETLGLPDGLTFNPTTATLSGTPTKTGAYVFAIKASNSLGSAVDIIHMSIAAKAPVAFNLSSDKSSVTIVQGTTVTATVTATGGSGNGAYSFTVDPSASAICSVAAATANTATMTVLAAGNCVIVGNKAADAGFAASKATITIPVNKASQTSAIVITPDATPLTFAGASTWLRATGGNGVGAFTWAIDPSNASICAVSSVSGANMYPTLSTSGTCVVNVTKAADGYFQAQTTSYSFAIGKANQVALYVVNNGASYWNSATPPSYNLSTGGGSGTGLVSYTIDPSSANTCSLSGTSITAKSAGICLITATKAGDLNYNSVTSPTLTWQINSINQPALATTGATPAGVAIAYNSNVQYVANPTYFAVLTTTGGAGTGTYSYVASNASGCVVSGNGATAYVSAAPNGTGIGWCTITITKAADVNYNVQSTTFQFYIPAGNQTTLVATPANQSMDFVATTLTDAGTAAKDQLTVTGGLGTGAITYAVANTSTTVCSVDATGLITDKTAGTCVINITKAADANYLVQTTQATVVFNKLAQSELVSNSANSSEPFVYSPKATNQITTTGGTGTGAVTYAVDPASSTICSVNASNGLITDITAGTCLVNVSKAADTNYGATSDTVTVVFTKINPAAISLSASPTSISYTTATNKNQTWVTVAGGTYSTGAFTFYVDPMTEEYCSIATIQPYRVLVNGDLAGICLITVVQAADVNYNEQRTILGFNITKMVQTIGATSSNGTSLYFKVIPDVVTTINVTNMAGTGAVHYVVDPTSTSSCVVDQSNGNVTSTTVGTCKVTVTRDGDDNVAASNAAVLNLTILKINQAVITLTPNADFKLAASGPAATSPLVIGVAYTGTGNFTKIVSTTPLICTISGGGDSAAVPATFTSTNDLTGKITVTALDDGTCTLQYSKLGDANFNVVTNGTASFTIGKATQADVTASITAGSATTQFVSTPKATATVAGAAGSGTGVFNYTVDSTSSTVCSVNLTTGVVTDITAGTCLIIVKRLTDTTFLESAPKTVTITFTKIDQVALTLTAGKLSLKATTSGLDVTNLTYTGGSGTGGITYSIAADSLTVCSISGFTVTGLAPGDCNAVVTKAGDANYNLASATLKLTVTKGTQASLTASWYYAGLQGSPVAFNPSTDQINYFMTSGGTGSGDLVFAIDPISTNICNNAKIRPGYPSQIIVSALGDGECKVKVYKSGGSAWDDSNSVTASFWIGKTAQATLTASASVSSIQYFDSPSPTFTVSVSGGSGTGANSISINPSSAAVCSDASIASGVLTVKIIGIGNCLLSGVKASSPGYLQATSSQLTITVTKGTQASLVATAVPSAITYTLAPKTTATVTVTGGSGNGAQTITVDSGSTAVCSYSDVTKLITALAPGNCDLTITKAAGADGLFLAQTSKLRVVVAKTAQTKLNLVAASTQLIYSDTQKPTTTLTLSGGSGTGAVTYTVDPGAASVCSVSVVNNVPVVTSTYYGFCVITATKAGDSIYADATATATIRIALAGTQIFASVPNSSESYVAAPGAISTVTVNGSLPNDVISYSVDSASKAICSVTGNGTTASVTSLSTGVCSILVIDVAKASDGTLIASSSVATFTITKGIQTAVTATPATASVYYSTPAATDVITVTGGVAGAIVSATVDASTSTNCSVTVLGNKITMTALSVGNCLINYTSSGNAAYSDFNGTVSVTVLKSKQADLRATSSPTSLVYSAVTAPTSTITVTGGSGSGALSYAVSDASSSICSITNNVITAITGGDCVVIATKAGDNNYADATASITVNIAKANQAAFSESATSANLTYDPNTPATTTLTTTGGSGAGSVTYAVAPASSLICSVDGNTVTALMPGNCVIVATRASDPYFNAITASTTIAIAKANQSTLTVSGTPSSLTYSPSDLVQSLLNASGGSGSGAVTYAVANASKTVCSINVDTITALAAGDCVITASKAADAYFNSTTATTTITIGKGAQATLVPTSSPTTLAYSFSTPATATITALGGSGTGSVTYAIADSSKSICSISGNKITALTSGDCVVIATKTGGSNFIDATGTIIVSISKALQANLVGSSSPASLIYSAITPATSTISVTGGTGSGLVTYALADASKTICSIAGNKITAITGGDCVVIATKVGDASYADAVATVTVNIAKGNQAALTVVAASQNLTYNPSSPATTTLTSSGGSGTGDVTYAVSPASASICSVSGNVVTALLPGNCVVNATKAADGFYNAISGTATITIAKAAQDTLSSTLATGATAQPEWNGVATTAYEITGGSGTGSLSIVGNSPTVCEVSISGSTVNINALAAGTCSFTVTKSGDTNYLASTALTKSFTVGSAATDLAVTVSSVGNAVAGGQGAIDLTITNLGPAQANGATVVYTIPTGVTVLSGLPSGCNLSGSQVTCVSSQILTLNALVKFTIPVSLSGSLVGGNYTTGGQVALTSSTPDLITENNNVSGNGANFIVNKAPTAFTKTTVAGMQTGKAFADQVTAVGFPAVTYTISAGDLPAGLSLDPDTGAITGIPTGVGAYSFTVSAYNSAGTISQVYSGSIAPAPFVTAPGNGFATNTVPTGTKLVIGGINLDLITAAIIGGKTVKILTKVSAAITLEVPSSSTSGTVPVSLVYGQGTIDAGTFTYTGVAKLTPSIVLNAGNLNAGAGENERTLTSAITAVGLDGAVTIPVTYTSKTPTVCTISANQLSFVAAGTCTVSASTAADSAFNAATSALVNLTVTKSSQTLTVVLPKDTVPPTAATDSADGFDLAVTASSGLIPSFVSTTPDICDVTDDGHVTGIKAGHCVVTITQAGDARFAPIAATTMQFDIKTDPGLPTVDNGDPLHPTSLANGLLNNIGDVGFTWNKKLAALTVQTYGIWIGKINAISEFTIAGKAYKCSVDFGILKAMASKTPAQVKLAMAHKTFKANAPFCNVKTEAAAYKALKAGYVGLNVKVTITRYRMFPTTYKPIIPKINKPIATQVRIIYINLG
jgi:hypothetical protein